MSSEHDPPPPGSHAEASGNARIYQAAGDQHIDEHHHHYPPEALESLFSAVFAKTAEPRTAVGQITSLPRPAAVRTPLVGSAPKVLRDRTELVQRLTTSVEATGGNHVLHGMGGCGKTALAQYLFRELCRGVRRVGFWVNASEEGTFTAGMLAVAADRGATAGELAAAHGGFRAPADLVWHYLETSAQPWLLVLDNADDPDFIEAGGWLREGMRGSVLITTRVCDSTSWGQAELHEVGVLPPEDAAQVLRDWAPHAGDSVEAEQMARRLDCLPLALTLAGSFLSHQTLEVWSMSDYQRHLEQDDPTELIDRGAPPHRASAEGRHLVSRTWMLSLDSLSRRGSPDSTILLRLLSCWASDPLPLELITPNAMNDSGLDSVEPPLHGHRVETALRGLLDQSLVSLVDLSDNAGPLRCLKTHGVLLDSVAAEIPDEQTDIFTSAASRLLEKAVSRRARPGRTADRTRLWVPHALRLLRRAAGGPAAPGVVRTAVRLAGEVHETGDYASAYSLGHRALDVAVHSGTHPAVAAEAKYAVATAAFRLGRFAESEALHREAWATRRRIFGDEHPETLQSRLGLHEPLGQADKLPECLETLREVAAVWARLRGERYEETLRVRGLMLEYLAVAGEVEQFDALGQVTVAACEAELGPEAAITVMAQHNYAFACHTFGRPEAEQAARRALALRERLHGEDHALTLSAAVLLSWVLRDSGHWEESVELARRVVSGQETALGRDHPYVLVNRKDLAHSLARVGARDQAWRLAEENLALCGAVLGSDDPVTVATRRLVEENRP